MFFYLIKYLHLNIKCLIPSANFQEPEIAYVPFTRNMYSPEIWSFCLSFASATKRLYSSRSSVLMSCIKIIGRNGRGVPPCVGLSEAAPCLKGPHVLASITGWYYSASGHVPKVMGIKWYGYQYFGYSQHAINH